MYSFQLKNVSQALMYQIPFQDVC